MTTFWIAFTQPDISADKRFLGVSIFDMDETKKRLNTPEIIAHSWKLGLNPGGAALIQEVNGIPEDCKNRLITDEALLMKLGSSGRAPE